MSWAESAFRHGGVCGSLSTFGATAAQAHGIPAYTCGQPGHCAYAVRFARKKWVGGFGGPAGWPHNYLWRGTYYSILMMEDAFFDDTSILRSERSLWLAHLYQSRDRATTYAAYDLAVRWCRPNYHAWDELISARLSDPATTPVEWKKLAEMLLVALQPHTQPMTELLDKFEDQHLLKNMTEPEKISWFTTVHRIIAVTKWEFACDWNMDDYFQKQAGKLKAQSAQWALYRNAISLHAAQDHFLGQLLAWGSKTAEKSGDPRQYIVAATAALRESGTSMKEATLKKTYSSLILAAEKARAMDAFQCVSDAACKGATAGDLLQVKLPADRVLVSGDGLFYASSTSGWDDPSRHRDVLRECGGQFHTSEEQAPYAVVQLKKPVMLTGVVLVNTEGNQDRAVPLKLYVSTDGATWLPVWESSRAQEQWIVPLSGKHIQARWIKVESQHGAGRNYFHLRNICVYGES